MSSQLSQALMDSSSSPPI